MLLLLFNGAASGGGGGGGASPADTRANGGSGGRLWEVYQEEIERRFRPKPKPKEPEPVQEPEYAEQPASGGFFDVYTDPAEMIARARANAEARANQGQLAEESADALRYLIEECVVI